MLLMRHFSAVVPGSENTKFNFPARAAVKYFLVSQQFLAGYLLKMLSLQTTREKWDGLEGKPKKAYPALITAYNETNTGRRVCDRCFNLDAECEFMGKRKKIIGKCSTCQRQLADGETKRAQAVYDYNATDPEERQCEKCEQKKPKVEFKRKNPCEGDSEYVQNCKKCNGKSPELMQAIETHNALLGTTKVCNTCVYEKPTACFENIQKSGKNGVEHNDNCRKCIDKAAAKLVQKCIPYAELLDEFKRQGCRNGCVLATGDYADIEADYYVISTKVHTVSELVFWCGKKYGVEKFKEELAKCTPLCSACHVAKMHSQDPDRVLTLADKIKITVGQCQAAFPNCKREICTTANVLAFEFNGIKPVEERNGQETPKCDVVCRGCHKKIIATQQAAKRKKADEHEAVALARCPARKFTLQKSTEVQATDKRKGQKRSGKNVPLAKTREKKMKVFVV